MSPRHVRRRAAATAAVRSLPPRADSWEQQEAVSESGEGFEEVAEQARGQAGPVRRLRLCLGLQQGRAQLGLLLLLGVKGSVECRNHAGGGDGARDAL